MLAPILSKNVLKEDIMKNKQKLNFYEVDDMMHYINKL